MQLNSKARCTSRTGRHAVAAAGLAILVVCARLLNYMYLVNSAPLSAAFWMALNKYNWVLDDRINVCFAEIPPVPYFWSNSTSGASCALREPPDGLTDMTKRTTLVQYAWAPEARSLSPRCQAFVAELRDRESKTVGNFYGLYKFDHIRRPVPSGGLYKLASLYKAELRRLDNGEAAPLPPLPRAPDKRSVMLNLFDALSRALYTRLIAPKLRAELDLFPSNQYTAFDFSRFHVVGYNSPRNYRALYTGRVPEIFKGMRSGTALPPEDDLVACAAEATLAWWLGNASKPNAALKRVCGRTLWGRYRDRGYLTTDYMVLSSSLGYFNVCLSACERLLNDGKGGGRLLSVAPIYPAGARYASGSAALQTLAGAFHSVATKERPLFATMQSEDAHNSEQLVHDLAYDIASFVRAIAASATARAVPLPLIVLHADHGSHYGDNTRTAAGRTEHRFPMLVMLVPKAMLERNAMLEQNLNVNRHRLVTAFDLHHTLLEFASSGESEKDNEGGDTRTRTRTGGAAPPEAAGTDEFGDIMTRRNLFREVVPADRTCADAGVEPYLCSCDDLTPCSMPEDGPAVAFQASVALAVLNARLHAMLQAMRRPARGAMPAEAAAPQEYVAPCAASLQLVHATGARTSGAPPALEFALTLRARRREARFFVTMACPKGRVRGGATRSSSYAATGESALRTAQRRFVPSRVTACAVSSLVRLSTMSGAEDEVYKTSGKDGKLCVIDRVS